MSRRQEYVQRGADDSQSARQRQARRPDFEWPTRPDCLVPNALDAAANLWLYGHAPADGADHFRRCKRYADAAGTRVLSLLGHQIARTFPSLAAKDPIAMPIIAHAPKDRRNPASNYLTKFADNIAGT
jgi:hypothetical protein